MKYTEVKACLKNTDRDTLKDLLGQFDEDLICKYQGEGNSLDTMQEAYQGKFYSDEGFVEYLCQECGDIPKDLPSYVYIDWERTARDIMTDFFEVNGHYFRSM